MRDRDVACEAECETYTLPWMLFAIIEKQLCQKLHSQVSVALVWGCCIIQWCFNFYSQAHVLKVV